jgi:hypothetical protein
MKGLCVDKIETAIRLTRNVAHIKRIHSMDFTRGPLLAFESTLRDGGVDPRRNGNGPSVFRFIERIGFWQPKPGTITSVGVDKRSILVSGVG